MLKHSKNYFTRKLDKECSRIIRSQGYCSKCKKDDYSKLHCCHIYSRKLKSVRFDLDNLICLCSSCHASFHDRPILFQEFVKEYLGEYKYRTLKSKATAIKQWKLDELQDLLKTLERK